MYKFPSPKTYYIANFLLFSFNVIQTVFFVVINDVIPASKIILPIMLVQQIHFFIPFFMPYFPLSLYQSEQVFSIARLQIFCIIKVPFSLPFFHYPYKITLYETAKQTYFYIAHNIFFIFKKPVYSIRLSDHTEQTFPV